MSGSRKSTILDVARQAGVSPTTVSRVLRGSESAVRISPATRERILDATRELGYTPNVYARALRTRRSALIGVIVRDVSDPFQSLVIKGIARVASQAHYRFLVSHIDAPPGEGDYSEILESHSADGVIIIGDLVGDETAMRHMQTLCPYVVVTGHPPVEGVPRVVVDNRGGIRALLEHLWTLGHRDIGFVWDDNVWDMRERHKAFTAFVGERGLALSANRLLGAPHSLAGGEWALNRLLDQGMTPTAVLFGSDTLAMGALRAAAEWNLRIPQDLSIAGFDDIPFAAYVTPGLTTVRQPIEGIGEAATGLLIDWLESGGPPPADPVVLQVDLVVRQSTARCQTR